MALTLEALMADNRRIKEVASIEATLLLALDALEPFAKMAEGKSSWSSDSNCAQFAKMHEVLAADVARRAILRLGVADAK